ncbi:hypothetical protein Lal_00018010 [Lupinus albus]|nr:hypothetical protein Lal_00018010 [Lupinus albus]
MAAVPKFNEYGVDGGPAAKALTPKFDALRHRVHSQVGVQLPQFDAIGPLPCIWAVWMTSKISYNRDLGCFILGTAWLIVCLHLEAVPRNVLKRATWSLLIQQNGWEYNHYHEQIKCAVARAIALKGLGGVLFIFGSNLGAILLILHQLIATPILYDFYNYNAEDKEFINLFIQFTQLSFKARGVRVSI